MKKVTLLLIITLSFIASCSEKPQQNSQDLILKNIDGSTSVATIKVQNSQKNFILAGANKPTIVVFWATHCPSCLAEVPHLVNLQKKYDGKIQIIALTSERVGPEKLIEFSKYHAINYQIFYGTEVFDIADALGGVRAIPAIFVFDKKGDLKSSFLGLLPPEILNSEIEDLI